VHDKTREAKVEGGTAFFHKGQGGVYPILQMYLRLRQTRRFLQQAIFLAFLVLF
jgi:hypothetical protein